MADCPVCRTSIRRVTYEGMQLYVCDRFKGMLVDDELAAMCLKKFIDVQRNGLPKDAYDFKCVKCSNRGGREYYKDDTIVGKAIGAIHLNLTPNVCTFVGCVWMAPRFNNFGDFILS